MWITLLLLRENNGNLMYKHLFIEEALCYDKVISIQSNREYGLFVEQIHVLEGRHKSTYAPIAQ